MKYTSLFALYFVQHVQALFEPESGSYMSRIIHEIRARIISNSAINVQDVVVTDTDWSVQHSSYIY